LTVNAPNVGVPFGTSVMISGTVLDVSPGTQNDANKLRFPNGVPVMSDASQSEWMLYVYKQFPLPSTAVGVDVVISVVDANGNFREIGTAQTDTSGKFNLQWTPDIAGKYTVIASFAGSGAYFGSYSQTAFGVEAEHPATPAPTATPPTVADMYLVPGIAGIIVAILVVGVVLALLMLRKRP